MKILFVCVHNAARSQMAEVFANQLGEGLIEAKSAGTEPATEVDPMAVKAMAEIGFDLSGKRPKLITPELVEWADRVITMGCGVTDSATCPVFAKPMEDWGLEDPHDQTLEKVRKIRDEIKHRVEKLIQERSRQAHT